MILVLDNFDSFTFNLVDYFLQLGVECNVVRNNVALSEITNKNYEGLVISPGPETPDKSGILMDVLEHYAKKIPVLGICLGHQAIGEFFGAKLVKATLPMHGKISQMFCDDEIQYANLPARINVVRYNSLVLKDVTSPLIISAHTTNNEVMSIRHELLPIWGLQFHPEAALTEHGLYILKNWLQANNLLANQ